MSNKYNWLSNSKNWVRNNPKWLSWLLVKTDWAKSDLFQWAVTIYNKLPNRKPLVVVPSSYSQVTEQELVENGINVVIYANHLLRAAYPAMVNTAKSILEHHRCKEASEQLCMPIKEVITLIPGSK